MIYLELFHGRKTKEEQLDNWGETGPVFGPLVFIHTTYKHDVAIRLVGHNEDSHDLHVIGDLLYYDGMYYGDWSAFDESALDDDHRQRLVQYDPAKAQQAA